VVANEVKELAAQTVRATAEIAEVVSAMSGATQDAVARILQVSEGIEAVGQHAKTMAVGVEAQVTTAAAIAEDITRSARAADQVSASIAQVSDGTELTAHRAVGVANSVQEIDEATHGLATSSKQLDDRLGQIAGLVEQTSARAAALSSSVEELRTLSRGLSERARQDAPEDAEPQPSPPRARAPRLAHAV